MSDDDVTLFGKLKNKLIDSKQKWAEDGRLLTGKTRGAMPQRLPPGQRQVETWPVLDLGIQPEIPTHAWRLFVDGEVENPMTWKWGEFTDLPKTTADDGHPLRHRLVALRQQVGGRERPRPAGDREAQGGSAARDLPFLRHLHDQRAARRFLGRRRAAGVELERRADQPGTWRPACAS